MVIILHIFISFEIKIYQIWFYVHFKSITVTNNYQSIAIDFECWLALHELFHRKGERLSNSFQALASLARPLNLPNKQNNDELVHSTSQLKNPTIQLSNSQLMELNLERNILLPHEEGTSCPSTSDIVKESS